MQNKIDRFCQRILILSRQICTDNGILTVSHIKKGHSTAVNYCVFRNQKPLFFAKIHKERITGIAIINQLNDHNQSFPRIIADRMVGHHHYCLITEWISGKELSLTENEARKTADILKVLHYAPVPDCDRHINPKLELLRYIIYIKTRHVRFPHKREILHYLRKNQHLHRNAYALTHMDMHCGNFMVDPAGTVHLIDYENMSITDPWRDFVYAVTFHGRKEDSFWLEVLRCYFDNQIPDSFWNTMKYYCYLHLLRMIICEHQKGNQWYIDYIATSIWEDFPCQSQGAPQWFAKAAT